MGILSKLFGREPTAEERQAVMNDYEATYLVNGTQWGDPLPDGVENSDPEYEADVERCRRVGVEPSRTGWVPVSTFDPPKEHGFFGRRRRR